MNNLYLKLHPTHIAWLIDNENYGVINLTSNLVENGKKVREELGKVVTTTPTEIIVEKPFLKLFGDNQKKLADDIIHVQRNFGVLLYILDSIFPDATITHVSSKIARLAVYKRDHISKDVQLSEAAVLLTDVRMREGITPLALLCLHDTLVLKKYRGVK